MSGTNAKKRSGRALWVALGILLILAGVATSVGLQIWRGTAVDYAGDEDHFKYGSITADGDNGQPYWIWATLPEVCPKLMPGGYASLGVIQEAGHPTPIGFSMRRKGILGDFVGPNCALCHSTPVRTSPSAKPVVYLTAPAQQLDLFGYYKFQSDCIRSADFTADRVIAAIKTHKKLSLLDTLIYRIEFMLLRQKGTDQGNKFDSMTKDRPPWGPGRVDTFNPYKVLVFNMPMEHDKSIGTADFMSIWDQKVREGLSLHWDGNNSSLDERNLSAAIGGGGSPTALNTQDGMGSINRIKAWITDKAPPAFPFAINAVKAAAGHLVYDRNCAVCHDNAGAYFGRVIELKYVQTDPERNVAFDASMAARMNTIGKGLGAGPFRQFSHFHATAGYASHPLDGIWLRAPYLHNGSVPTMVDLLNKPEQRPVVFYRGYDVYDPVKLGFVSDVASDHVRDFYKFDTKNRGNGNSGHLYGVNLTAAHKGDLIEYLKTK